MDTSHNYLREPSCEDYPFIGAKRYIDGLSQPEKEDILASMAKDVGKIRVENIPDEEDLTQVRQGCHHVLKFKDKIFNPAECSGMGKVFLRKNMVQITCDTSKNILTQSMFEDKHGLPMVNTIFIIQYDYDLDGGFITLPENSVLLFAGGSLRNGTVMLRNTLVLPVALDIEHYMSVNIRGAYKEGSLVYLRKKLRLFDGTHWITIGAHDLTPVMNAVKKYLNFALDIVAPFKIELSTEKNYVEHGLNNIRVSWSYNRLINNQDIRLESGHDVRIYEELDKNIRSYTFENVELNEPATIVVSTTYKGETVSEAVTLTFDKNPGLVIDDELDENSTNPVTNRAITRVIRSLEQNLENFQQYVNETFLTKVDAENTYLKQADFDLSEVYDALGNKVDKEAGKGLSSNDFTDSLKDKLEGINLDNYALKNHTHTEYADKNHTHSEYANVNHTHVISDVQGLAEALSRAGVTYQLSKDGSNLVLVGSDGSRSSVAIAGIDENALKTLIQAKLRLLHGNGTISLTYDGTNLATVQDEKGGSEGGVTEDDVKNIIKNNLDVTHVGDIIKLKYGNTTFGTGTKDMTGEGGGGGDDDGLPGNILIYFLKTSSSNTPETPEDGQISDLSSSSGTWLDHAPNHETGKYIWMSQIYETHTGNNYGNWATPILIDDGQEGGSAGSDTTDIEYIFAVSNIEDFNLTQIHHPEQDEPVQRDDYVPNQWSDTALGIDENHRYEFISYRVKVDRIWGRFSVPVLWSAYGRDGIDGNGVEYIFFKGRTAPQDTPTQNPHRWYTNDQSKADVNKQSFNKDEYILSGSGWTDDPEDLEPGESVWVSIRKYRNDSGSSSAEETDAYWHQYSDPALWSHYGTDSISAGVLDFDNETMTVPVNSETGKNYSFTDIAYAYIFYGEGSVPISNLIFDGLYNGDQEITNSHVRVSISGNKVTVSIDAEGLDFSQIKNYALRFTGQSTSLEDRTGTIKLIGVQSGKDGESYKLSLNAKVVKKQVGTQTGLYIPEAITPKLVITGGDNQGTYTPTEIGSNPSLSGRFEIKYGIDGGTLYTSPNSIIMTNAINNFIVVALFYNGDIIDQETIFMIEDGHDGIPGTVYNIIPVSSNVKYDGTKTGGTVQFKVSRQVGSNPIEYQTQGGEQWGSVNAYMQNEQSSINPGSVALVGDTYNSSFTQTTGEYDYVKVTLSVSDTVVTSIFIPVIKNDSGGGTQTLEYSVLRNKPINSDDSSNAVWFYCGRNVAESGVKYQDFVKWNGTVGGKSPNDQWGTYLCIKDVETAPKNIPSDTEHFVKLDYDFSVVASYLIADRAFIESLSVNQLVVLNNAENEVVAGMTSGRRLPESAEGRSNDNDIRIWAGRVPSNGDISSAAFTVDSSGHVKANNITINGSGTFSGTVNADSGTFSGEVNATQFNVYDGSVSPNNLRMSMSTWNNVKDDVDTSKIDSDTLTKLNANPSSPVIVLSDGTNQYILNMLALGGGGGTLPNEYFITLPQSQQGDVDINTRGLVTQYDESTDTYYRDNGQTLVTGETAYEYYETESSQGVTSIYYFDPIYVLLDKTKVFNEVTFTNGKKQYTGTKVVVATLCTVEQEGQNWVITRHSENENRFYRVNTQVSPKLVNDSFNTFAFVAPSIGNSRTVNPPNDSSCIGNTPLKVEGLDTNPANIIVLEFTNTPTNVNEFTTLKVDQNKGHFDNLS